MTIGGAETSRTTFTSSQTTTSALMDTTEEDHSSKFRAKKLRTALRVGELSPPPVELDVLEDAFEAADLDPSRYIVTSGLSDPKKAELKDARADLAAALARNGVDPGYRIGEFEADVDAYVKENMDLGDMPSSLYGTFETFTAQLVPVVSYWPQAEVLEAKGYMRENGARARHCRDWKGAVANTREEREKQEDADEGDPDPSDLSGGEITAWIVDQVEADDHFAVGPDGCLYYYEDGCYHAGGDDYLNKRIVEVLDAENMVEENSSYRRTEVQELVEITAPELWDEPRRDRLCLKNGILNLDTGEFEEHGPRKWLSTRQIPIEHDPDAEGGQWRDFLHTVMPGDDPVELGYELMAYLLMPPKGRRRAVYLKGPSQTGKSTFIRNFVEGVMGESTVKSYPLQDLEENDHALAELLGSTLNVCADLPSRPMKGTSIFKQITGGDWMMAEKKYKDPFRFKPHCHLLFSGNGPIKAPDAGEAFWSRWHVVPFDTKVGRETGRHVEEEQLDAALQDPEQLSALLNEILRVLRRVREDGIRERTCMTGALAGMRGHTDNDVPEHSGDSAAPNQHPDTVPEPSISETATDERRGDPGSKNFEKERDSDTGGVCVREESSTKSFSEGDAVRGPDGERGTVMEEIETDPPEYSVRLRGGGGSGVRFPAEDLEPVADDDLTDDGFRSGHGIPWET